jgi:hypothetical protein
MPVNLCDKCGNPSFAIYLNADGKLCDECEDKRRGEEKGRFLRLQEKS